MRRIGSEVWPRVPRLTPVLPMWLVLGLAATLAFLAVPTAHSSLACIVNPCVHGICIESSDNSEGYSCYCVDGYTGIHCQTNWDECWSSPCLNGGSCVDGIATYNCTCPDGFMGDRCEENLDECGSNPCMNNGTCIDHDNGFTCHCLPGYSGIFCETDIAVCNTSEEARCLNGGLCLEGPGIAFSCKCTPGWVGKMCQTPVDECASSPCKNGAVCIDLHANYVCACPVGYTGKDCDVELELCQTNTCENNALCVMEDMHSVCYCVPDYHGDRCQFKYDECQKGPGCFNGGTCVDGVDSYSCSCPPGIVGRFCECVQTDTGLDCTHIRPTSLPPYHNTTADVTLSVLITSNLFTSGMTSSAQDWSTMGSWTSDSEGTTYEATLPDTGTSPEETWTDAWTSPGPTSPEPQGTFFTPPDPGETPAKGSGSSLGWFTQSSLVPTDIFWSFGTKPPTSIASPDYTGFHIGSTFDKDITTPEISWVSPEDETTESVKESLFPSTEESTEAFMYSESTDITEVVSTALSSPATTDCSQTSCLNGGTCYYGKSGPKCECPFGWKGPKCGERGGVRTAALTSRSYLVHSLSNTTQGLLVSLTLRTLAKSGVILYARPTPPLYMALYLQEGLLKFQFSCGIQTMLLSELRFTVNTGYPLRLMAMIEVVSLLGAIHQCSGIVRVNDSLAMSGEQTASEQSLYYQPHHPGLLYIGAIPPHLVHMVDLPVKEGVVACMASLQIDGEDKEIYSGAIDGYDVGECSSLACLSSPCYNGATCMEVAHKWNCLCPNGYVGETCSQSVCINNPCLFGATCVRYPGSGFICLCPLGKHGLYCDQDMEIGQPMFASTVGGLSSYTSYALPGPIHHSFELRFRFVTSTLDQIGLMLFIGQSHPHDSTSDHLAVSFIKGFVVLTWNLGSGPRRIFTPKAIVDSGRGREVHSVRLGRLGQQAWLQVDMMTNVTGTSPGWLTQLNTQPRIYIGGHESKNFSGLPHDLPLHSGYLGCIYDVQLRAGKVQLDIERSKDVVGRNVGQCGTKHCHNTTCHHGGVCIDHGATFACMCADGWFGPGCTMRYNPCDSTRHKCAQGSTCVPLINGYQCDCPLGASGQYCQQLEPLSDVRFTGHRSFLSLPPASLDLPENCIEFDMKPSSPGGLVLFTEQIQGYAKTFLSLALHGGILELRVLPLGGQRKSGEVIVVRSGKVLSLGEWTRVKAGRYGNKMFLWVDGTVNAGKLHTGETLLPSHKPLFIGGIHDFSELPSGAVAGLPVPFVGCIRRLKINWRSVTLDNRSIIDARNIVDCDGTPCGGDVCQNYGTCWLNPDNTPMCSCPKHYTGNRCEDEVSCAEAGCENGGRCVRSGSVPRCHCPTRWTGPFCTREVNAGAPHFGGDGFLILDPGHGLAKRGGSSYASYLSAKSHPITELFINFTTAQIDGMIMWTAQEGDVLGLGVEAGLMKVVWAKGDAGTAAVLVPGVLAADGAWHSLRLTFEEGNLTFQADSQTTQPYSINDPISTDGIFYLGGFPEGKTIITETDGNFENGFSGCIKEISLNGHLTVTDFTKYRGENIRSCELFYP